MIVTFYCRLTILSQAEDFKAAISDMKSGKTIKPVLVWK